MFPTVYVPYVAFTIWALVRAHGSASRADGLAAWRLTAVSMLLLPVLVALVDVLLLIETEQGIAVIVGSFAIGGAMFVAGLVQGRGAAPAGARFLRVAGWSVAAGITMVPSWLLVLLLPVVGLAAFLVPGDYGAGSESRRRAPNASRA